MSYRVLCYSIRTAATIGTHIQLDLGSYFLGIRIGEILNAIAQC